MNRPYRIILSILVGLAIGAGVLYVTNPDDDSALPEFARNQAPEFADYGAILRIYNDKVRCTAFVIGTHYAVTAGHCTTRPWYHFGYGKRDSFKVDSEGKETGVELVVVGARYDPDYALLTGDLSKFKSALINPNTTDLLMNVGSIYLACGYPMGNRALLCNPFVSRVNEGFAVAGQGPVLPGMSGGPVINMATGATEGLIWASLGELTGVYPITGILDSFGVPNHE